MFDALNDAKQRAGADNLVNVAVDERVTYYPFTLLPIVTTIETIVYGTAVRYKDSSLRPTKDLSGENTPPPAPKVDKAPPPTDKGSPGAAF